MATGRSLVARRLAGAGAGLLLDRLLGELPVEPHPVAAFGTAMTSLEKRIWDDDRRAGVRYAAVGLAAGLAAGKLAGSTALATYLSAAGRMLGDTAVGIGDALGRGDLDAARSQLPSLVGRDPTHLDEGEIVRAVVESVAENTVDAIVAPAWWAVVGGAPAVSAHRAANTMDAMVGNRSPRYERFGWASARVDDVLNWVPSRLTGGLVMLVRPSKAEQVWRVVTHDAGAHPSPNAGVAEAAFAAALGVRLGGVNRYGERVERRTVLGDGRPPEVRDIAEAVRLSNDVTSLLAVTLMVAAATIGLMRRRT